MIVNATSSRKAIKAVHTALNERGIISENINLIIVGEM
jgi:3-oxoacyl-[acyl-carrier-protein] synthase III